MQRPTPPPIHRSAAILAAVGLLGLSLAACGGPDAGDVAADLATALTKGSVADIPTVSGTGKAAQESLTSITTGLGDVSEKVTVKAVGKTTEDADGVSTAVATLSHSWVLPVGAGGKTTWSYDTKATLQDTDDGWAVRWQPSVVADLASGETLSLRRIQPARADVLGAGATTLVTNRPVTRLGIDKSAIQANQAESSARALAALAGVDPDSYAKRVVAAGSKAFVQAIVLRSEQVTVQMRTALGGIAGAAAYTGEQPLAPTKDFARPILGSVGEVTEELLKKDPDRYAQGDTVGLSGLQARYDEQLGGERGAAVEASREGGTARTLFQTNAVPGTPLTTTLDQSIQTTAEQLLAGVTPASAIVVIRPSTGDVLAAASGPGGDGYSTATLGKYAPGSTFKVVTSLALLRTGLTPDSPVQCPASITVDGRTFSNYSDFPAGKNGTMTLREALALSCNTAFIGASQKLTSAQLASAAASLGIGWDAKASGADVYTGTVPTDVTATENAAARIGQGKVTASPLAMATVVASVVKGSTVVPRLVSDPAPPANAKVASALTSAEASSLRSMMAAVVTGGTGEIVGTVPGQPVIAKTGTAEYGTANPPATRAWMVAGRGDLAVAVFVADGASGSHTAGPIMRDLLTKLPV